jgi:DNA replication and repair protein RecF
VWDVAISEYGSYIIEQRIEFIEQINSLLNGVYVSIANKNDIISAHYSHTYIGDIKQKILNELSNSLEKDKQQGSTTVGPHRHDIIFNFNNSLALTTASRGEIRTIILALKFLEVDMIEKITGKKPIVLLDDVFSELDETRQKTLSNTIRGYQTIITTTHILPGKQNYQHIKLVN